MFKNKTIWLIGASSDIALSFIKKYGSCFGKLILAGRKIDLLSDMVLKYGCKNASVAFLDLTDKKSINDFMLNAPMPYGVIFFAGWIDYIDGYENNSEKNIMDTVEVNYLGPIIMMEKLSIRMQKNKEGFIALLSSAGEIRGKYSNRFYVSSKKAITTYLEGLMQRNEKYSVKTMIFKLGHVDTKMLKKIQQSRKPIFVATTEEVADFLFKSIKTNRSIVKYYRPIWRLIAIAYGSLPYFVYKHIDV